MRVTLLVTDGMADSGFALLLDVFTAANLLADRVGLPSEAFQITLWGTAPTVLTGYGMQVTVDHTAAPLDDPPDVVIAPSLGLTDADRIMTTVRDHTAVPALAGLRDRGVEMAGACSGTFFLAEAGILTGLDATTSWWLGPTFRARYPDVALDESEALVAADGVLTAGAAMAHLDLGLALVARKSPALAEMVSSYLAVGDRPRQAVVARPTLLAFSDPTLAAFDRYIREQIEKPIGIADAAAAVGVSQRTLQRLTATVLGISPLRFLQQVRLDLAVDLLRTTDRSLTAIAHAVGYQDAATLRTLMTRRRGVSPSELRRRRL